MINRLIKRISATLSKPAIEDPLVEEPVPPSVPIPAELISSDIEGIDIVPARELIEANRRIIEEILDSFGNQQPAEGFKNAILELIYCTADWMGPIPAPHVPSHQEQGGMFAHSLQLGLTALALSKSKDPPKTPYLYYVDPRAADLAWQLLAFTGGLLRDFGKISTIGNVQAVSVVQGLVFAEHPVQRAAATVDTIWHPMDQGFHEWARTHQVLSYHIDGDAGSHAEQTGLTLHQIETLIPTKIRQYFYTAHRQIFEQYEDLFRDPASTINMPIFSVLRRANYLTVTHAHDPWWRKRPVVFAPRIIESFATFALSIQWNQTGSAFIYAAFQREPGLYGQHYSVPFFVATKASIAALNDHMFENGGAQGTQGESRLVREMFGLLEKADIMHRTVDGMLPEQKPFMAIPDYLPASLARVQFDPVGSDETEAPLEQMLVIPLSVRVPPHAYENMPTLAFIGDPRSPNPVVPFRLAHQRREMEKARVQFSLGHIPSTWASQSDLTAQGVTRRVEPSQSKPVVPPSQLVIPGLTADTKHDDTSEDRKAKPAEPRKESDLTKRSAPQDADPIPAQEASAHARRIPDDSVIEAEACNFPDDAWIMLYEKTMQTPAPFGSDPRRMFWASVWLFFYGAKNPKCEALTLANGRYAFLGRFLSNAARTAYSAALREQCLDLGSFSQFWIMQRISSDKPRVAELFEDRKDSQRRAVMQFDDQTGKIISDILNGSDLRH